MIVGGGFKIDVRKDAVPAGEQECVGIERGDADEVD